MYAIFAYFGWFGGFGCGWTMSFVESPEMHLDPRHDPYILIGKIGT